jgi:uncharacterized protein (DUF433 family)
MTAVDELIAMPMPFAARLAELSQRKLRYWEDTVLIGPSIQRRLSLRKKVRLYTFDDLVSLLVAAELIKRKFSVQHIRRVVTHLREFDEHPLSKLEFATAGREIYFKMPDGTWSGDRQPHQIVMDIAIPLEPIRAKIRAATARQAEDVGQVERRRGTQGHKPVFAGTRIPVQTVTNWLAHGFTDEQILAAYPDLRIEDIQEARTQSTAA